VKSALVGRWRGFPQRPSLGKSEMPRVLPGPKPLSSMTLGNAAAAGVRLIVWCRDCAHQAEPDPVEQAQRYGTETAVPEWREQPSSRGDGRPGRDPGLALRPQSSIEPLITVWCICSKFTSGFLGKVEVIRLLRLPPPISPSPYFGRARLNSGPS
jgi:hypothetical protein